MSEQAVSRTRQWRHNASDSDHRSRYALISTRGTCWAAIHETLLCCAHLAQESNWASCANACVSAVLERFRHAAIRQQPLTRLQQSRENKGGMKLAKSLILRELICGRTKV